MSFSRRRFLTLSLTGAAALATHPWTGEQTALGKDDASWQSAPALPWAAQEIYCTTWKGQIVVAGGLRSGADSNRTFTTLKGTALFDPATDRWTQGPDLPSPRHHIVLGTAAGRAYGFGGFVGETLRNGFQYRDDVYAFDGEQWARVGSMPAPLGETVALSLDNRIHLITGSLHGSSKDERGAAGTHLVYDANAETWSEAKPAPTPRSSATGAVIDGKLYVAGGRRREEKGLNNLGTLERYDPETDTWRELTPLPQPSGGLAGAALGGILYCFGGEYFSGGGGVYEHTWAYEPTSDAWIELPPMPTPRHGLAGTAIDDRVFTVGGNTAAAIGAETSATVETLTPSEN